MYNFTKNNFSDIITFFIMIWKNSKSINWHLTFYFMESIMRPSILKLRFQFFFNLFELITKITNEKRKFYWKTHGAMICSEFYGFWEMEDSDFSIHKKIFEWKLKMRRCFVGVRTTLNPYLISILKYIYQHQST